MVPTHARVYNYGKSRGIDIPKPLWHRFTHLCTTVNGGETTSSDNLIYIPYAILIGAMAWLHMQKVGRLYHRFQSDVESFQTSISAYSLSASINRYKQEHSFLQKEMIYVSTQRATIEQLVG